ncbi:amino acid adenylation domain-containing protein [Streptomyces sp. AS02]|uniref:amino acid adenylation domain-containing protein n=1 Tax=Streptomyces sp. AS02 TaxID=2938946 RepID=UPI0020227E02|nr:amino acid adenylation domain-containing protein [Streptomyces sp. AS02]MCL8017553.1 amino acid adenylation domain-containing protein [Streptomyces sp. AS02]
MASAQERLWIVERLTPGTSAYNIPLAVRLRGPLDRDALHRALQHVLDRHEALRTRFTQIDGQAVQVVDETVALELPVTDVTEADLAQRLAAAASQPFDLASGPLLRTSLLRLGPEDHVLAVTLHHLVSDMWSCGIFMQEVGSVYASLTAGRAVELPELDVHYPDFSVWQRERLADGHTEELLAYWRERMADAPQLLELPLDRPRPAVQSLRGRQLQVALSPELSAAVTELSRASGATPFMTLLGAFQLLLSNYSGQRDIVVSTGVATRTPETEGVIGCFINTVLLRTSTAGDPTFTELLDRVKATTVEALEHQELPFQRLVDELQPQRDLSVNPLTQVLFLLQNAPEPALLLPGLDAAAEGVERGGAQCDLNIQLRQVDGEFTGFVEYAADLFDEATIRRLWDHYEVLLTAATAAPDRRVGELPYLTGDEVTRAVAEWNATEAAEPGACLHELFERQVRERPGARALVWSGGEITYSALDTRADRLAGVLRGAGIGPDVPVAICLDRSVALATAVLGVLKAGGAYVPLDADYPAERLAFMLADSRPAVLLTDADHLERLPVDPATGRVSGLGDGTAVRVVLVDPASGEVPESAAVEEVAEGPAAVPADLAYVIYTSGSTGRPKGVAVTHRGAANNIADLNRGQSIGPGDSVLSLSSLSFDMSVYELLGMLAAGGTTVLPDADAAKDPRHWADLVERYGVTVWNSAPALLDALVDGYGDTRPARPTLRVAFLGGDWVPVPLPDRARALFPGLDVVVMGGATEASIHSILQRVTETGADWVHIPYGRPMANQQALIVDADLRPVPVGVPGELCLGGIGLARGYLNRPGLTAERFLPHPYAGAFPGVPEGARLYRTGDLARYAQDGTIHLIGRLDHQVKVRGFRIELGEVDAALGRHPDLAEAVTVVRSDDAGHGVGLTAYVVPAEGATPSVGELRKHLSATLPDHMVPDAFAVLDALPLSANGKVDRRALSRTQAQPVGRSAAHVAPRTPLERAIAEIWAEVLQTERVGLHDDFFELGGNSLGVTQIAYALSDHLRLDVSLRDLFDASTVAGQAALAQAAGEAAGVDAAAIAEIYLQVRALDATQTHDLLDTLEEKH